MKAAQNARLEGTGRGHVPYTESSPSSSPRSFLAPPPTRRHRHLPKPAVGGDAARFGPTGGAWLQRFSQRLGPLSASGVPDERAVSPS